MTKRRVAAAATTSAKAAKRAASTERRAPITGDMTFRDAVMLGGLLRLTMKETFR